jgi:predicted nucleic acid-binding protein
VIVLDASIAAKLYREEPDSGVAQALIAAHVGQMVAPDLFAVEVAGVIVRDANSDKRMADLQREKLASLAALLASPALRLVGMEPDGIVVAARMAMDLGHPVKDCIYLVLAMELGCPLVTADARFAGRASTVYNGVRVLGDRIRPT